MERSNKKNCTCRVSICKRTSDEFMSLYTKKSNFKAKPVLVGIHGGGWVFDGPKTHPAFFVLLLLINATQSILTH